MAPRPPTFNGRLVRLVIAPAVVLLGRLLSLATAAPVGEAGRTAPSSSTSTGATGAATGQRVTLVAPWGGRRGGRHLSARPPPPPRPATPTLPTN
eukprot:6205213-Pyramimonas_sp.AAC.1